MLRRKRSMRKGSVIRVPLEPAVRKNHRWSIDFLHDSLVTGRRIKCLTIVDDFTKELTRIEVGHSSSSFHLVAILEEPETVMG
jgi:putative transposase